MKTVSGYTARSILHALVFLAGLGWGTHASASAYLIDLNAGTATELGISAFSINEAGQMAGSAQAADGFVHAFFAGPGGVGMRDLGTLGGNESSAFAINDAG